MNPIPPITSPLGRSWRQPDHQNFLFDDTHVLMSLSDFEALAEYSTTMPTGVYDGKIWKRDEHRFNRGWLLVWYGNTSDVPDSSSIEFREILVVSP